ncbi:hypothetical protein ANCCAN_11436 [Ancylostoma caninum]|uniref:Uncharacterized protein n=1 Tax=Ancylostoma caninum TaxID=29170 RepID=A0A368GHV9_ANCCA|nr:hypothetical protein ANCCAN_11436 [Ancylostoma caninum]
MKIAVVEYSTNSFTNMDQGFFGSRHRSPSPPRNRGAVPKYPQWTSLAQVQWFVGTVKNEQKRVANDPRCTDTTSGSSSGPEPMSSPTLSRVSSTISSHSLVEIFPFDSDIFVEKANSAVKKENKEVALRNPNTVALCPPPRMITGMSPRIPTGVPDVRGSFGGNVQPKPHSPTVRDLMRKLRKMSRVDVSLLIKTLGYGLECD